MELDLSDFQRLADLFSRMMEAINRDVLSYLSEERLTPRQLQSMRFLGQHEDCLIGEVAEGLEVSYAAASKLINRLIGKGWTDRRQDEADRRSARLRITRRGRELIQRIEQRRRQRIAEIFLHLEAKEQRSFIRGLTKFLQVALLDEEMLDRACLHCGSEHSPHCPINQIHLALTGREIQR